MTRALLALVIGTLLTGIPASAHHAFSAMYFEDRSISIQGEVQEFRYRNPHAILLVQARDAEGHMRTYAAEWAAAVRLAGQGITKDAFKPGDFVIVTGSPGRLEAEHRINLKCIRRPADGWSWTADRPGTAGDDAGCGLMGS